MTDGAGLDVSFPFHISYRLTAFWSARALAEGSGTSPDLKRPLPFRNMHFKRVDKPPRVGIHGVEFSDDKTNS